MHQKTRIAGHSHRGDRFDLQQEIRIGEPAQNAQRAGRRRAGEISLQDAARLRYVVRVADVDRDLGHVGDLGAAGGKGLGQVSRPPMRAVGNIALIEVSGTGVRVFSRYPLATSLNRRKVSMGPSKFEMRYTATAERVLAGARTIQVARVRITEAGRPAIATATSRERQ
jgi:hypothetical protein